jgi:hypothetical protein
MNNISFDYLNRDDIIETNGIGEIEKIWNTLFQEIDAFLVQNNYSSVASIDKHLLANVILDFLEDINRLKSFHKIDKINSQKHIAYTAYWLLRRKPIQIYDAKSKVNDPGMLKELTTVNERFVLQYILNYLSVRKRESHILERSNQGLENFSNMMLYYLIYRLRDAQSLEMILMAFLAGQVYEQIDKDISHELHQYDNA